MGKLILNISKKRLTTLCAKQLPIKNIAKVLGCSASAIERRISAWAIPYMRPIRDRRFRHKDLHDRYFSGTPVKQLADELGISKDAVYSRLRRYQDLLAEQRAIEARKKTGKEA
jgi:DNA-directed RNA polymerase specialized sigma24 family protein